MASYRERTDHGSDPAGRSFLRACVRYGVGGISTPDSTEAVHLNDRFRGVGSAFARA